MKNYYINDKTLWLEENLNNVFIQEKVHSRYLNNYSLDKIINSSCLYYGCSFLGRKKGSEEMIGKYYKIPIIVKEKEKSSLIVFPMFSKKNKDNIWFVYNNILNYKQLNKKKILVNFVGGLEKTFNLSYYMFHQQILRCSILKITYDNRHE